MSEVDLVEMTHHSVNARRNYYMGLWAGRQLGLNADDLQQYASSVMKADEEEPGPFDMIRKVSSDFRQLGRKVSESQLLEQLKAFEKNARAEMCATD